MRVRAPFTGDQEQRDSHEHAEHHNVVREEDLGQADSERGGENSEHREDRLCGEKPAKELSQVLVGELVEEEAEGKNNGAGDNPIDVVPKHSRLVEERAEGWAKSQQPDGIENAEQAEVNQRQVVRPAAKEEKSHCSKSDRQKNDGGRNVGEFPAQL